MPVGKRIAPLPADEAGGGEPILWGSIYCGLIRAGVRPESIARLTPAQIHAILLPRARTGGTILMSFDDALRWRARNKQPATIAHPGLAALAAIAMRVEVPQPTGKPRRTDPTRYRQFRSDRRETALSPTANESSIANVAQPNDMTLPVTPSGIELPIADAEPIANVESIAEFENRSRKPAEPRDEEKSFRSLLHEVIARLDELLAQRPMPFVPPRLDLTPRFSDGP